MDGYAEAAPHYWQAGWKGILPLPAGKKTPVPRGWTGYDGGWPSFPDIQAWGEEYPDGNVALRLPNSVVGIDVDAYAGKRGAETLAHAVELWGELPDTVRSTSRLDDPHSGIQLFTVPPGTELETVVRFPELGLADIEVVQFFHRYLVCWPSRHPDTNRRYRWLGAHGEVGIPRPGELPSLPDAWLEGLRRGTSAQITTHADVDSVLSSLPGGAPSPRVQEELAAALRDLTDSGSRHDNTLRHVLALFRLAERGEDTGIASALEQLGSAFVRVLVASGGRDEADAQSEWSRMVTGQRGHDLIASTPTPLPLNQLIGRTDDWDDDDNWDDEPVQSAGEPDLFDQILMGVQRSTTSWGPVDLDAVLAGDLTPEQPEVMSRTDDKPLLYRGRINGLVGESESGKSWCALLAARQMMMRGRPVVFLDFEDTAQSVVGRLLALGVPRNTLRAQLAYINPDGTLGVTEQEELAETLDTHTPDLVVVDGVNASMTLLGLDLRDNKEATQFHQTLLKPMTMTGAAVVVVDHVTKSRDERGPYAIGAQAKRAMMDGAMVGVECVETFGRGKLGKLELTILKDKPGGVRAIAEKRGKKDYIGSVTIDARDPDRISMELFVEAQESPGMHPEEKRLIVNMINISQYLENHPDGASMNKIIDEVPGKRSDLRGAVKMLVEKSYIVVHTGPNRSQLHTLRRPYLGPESDLMQDAEG